MEKHSPDCRGRCTSPFIGPHACPAETRGKNGLMSCENADEKDQLPGKIDDVALAAHLTRHGGYWDSVYHVSGGFKKMCCTHLG